jgi:uncharacterized protein YukE
VSGTSLADSLQPLLDTIRSQEWVDDALTGAPPRIEVASTAMDPFSPLPASGLGWAMAYFEPLREILDDLTGKPDVVDAHVAAWHTMADELDTAGNDLGRRLDNDLPDWHGEAADAYRDLMIHNVEATGGMAVIAWAMASATESAGRLVERTRGIVRDLITDLVARVIVWATEARFVATIPEMAAQIAAAVAAWGEHILTYTGALITSLTNLSDLLNG